MPIKDQRGFLRYLHKNSGTIFLFSHERFLLKAFAIFTLNSNPHSLVSTTEELLDRKVTVPVYKTEDTAGGIRHADHVAPCIRKRWHSLRRQAAVAQSV
jgi:hypothetical protein